MQADVETVHNLIETEFLEIESFSSRTDFFNKAYTYQLFFNSPDLFLQGKQNPLAARSGKSPHLPIDIAKIQSSISTLLLNFYLASSAKYHYHGVTMSLPFLNFIYTIESG